MAVWNHSYPHNREAWLTDMAEAMREFAFKGFELKPFNVSCGFPSRMGLGIKRRVIGECHAMESSNGESHEIFISPLLITGMEAAGTLAHEIAHVAAGVEAQHGAGFVKVCKYVGLTSGKPTSAHPGEKLNAKIAEQIKKMGEYPHRSFSPRMVKKSPKKSNLIRLECPCGCNFRMTKSWLVNAGVPTCGCGEEMTVS
jgi:hypothetical protein